MIRVLIVDDEDAILSMLKLVLESAEFQIETAHSAAQAQTRLQKEKFDVVLTDMRMESVTAGYDVVRAARQLQPRPAIAILTAFPIAASEWRKSGADALLIKGSEILRLPETLQSLRKVQLEKESIPESSRYANRRTG